MNDSHFPSRLTLPVNTSGRDFFVGDLHGNLAALERALEALDFNTARDRLISVGDLVDRGNQVVELLELYHASPWFHACLGSHDAMMRDSLRRKPWATKAWSHYNA